MSDFEAAFKSGDFATAERLARERLGGLSDADSHEAVRLRAHIGVCQAKTGRRAEAEAVLCAEADAADSWEKRWMVARAMARAWLFGPALEMHGRLLEEGPRTPDLLARTGDLMVHLGRYAEAEALLREAAGCRAGHPQAAARIGSLLGGGGPAARAVLDRFTEVDTTDPRLRVSLALALLAQGKWLEAWPYYESRRALLEHLPEMPYPAWTHDFKPGRVTLLRAEQGVGDTIMFARFAVLLAAFGQTVMLMTAPRLRPLLSTLPGVAQVITPRQRVGKADVVWAPLESLAGFFRLTPSVVPAMERYLAADSERTARWREWLPREGLRVGIAWQGAPGKMLDAGRSVPLAEFAPLADLPGVRLVSLQKGFGEEQVATCGFGARILSPGPDFDAGRAAFIDTAALMMSLDLIVTSDTSIAHLAGALGRPCFLALRKYPEWRWGMEGETTPWYPSMRLFRQIDDGDWTAVFARIAAALRTAAQDRNQR